MLRGGGEAELVRRLELDGERRWRLELAARCGGGLSWSYESWWRLELGVRGGGVSRWWREVVVEA